MYWNIATEDELSEATAERIVQSLPVQIQILHRFRKRGFGYLRANTKKWCGLAKTQTILLITDLDRAQCPVSLIYDWFGDRALPERLLVRVAIRETESWLLADHEGIQALLGKKMRLPDDPDALQDPKLSLLELAKRAPKEIRLDLVKQEGPNLRQGMGYNTRLTAWVRSEWSPERAAARSESLRRALLKIQQLAVKLSKGG